MIENKISCKVKVVHKDIVERVSMVVIDDERASGLELFFKVFADSTRIRILSALLESELCVCDLCAVLGLKQSTVSQQMRLLRQMRIVKTRSEGKSVYYSLDDEHISEILKMGQSHIDERK